MNLLRVALFLMVVSPLLAAPAPKKEVKPTAPKDTLDGAIAHGIDLLKGKKYVEFLRAYAPPKFIEKMDDEKLKKFAETFAAGKAKVLLDVLEQIKGTKPKMSADGKQATFELKAVVNSNDKIVWYKNGKSWYISN